MEMPFGNSCVFGGSRTVGLKASGRLTRLRGGLFLVAFFVLGLPICFVGCTAAGRVNGVSLAEDISVSKIEIDAAVIRATQFIADTGSIPESLMFPAKYVVDWHCRHEQIGRKVITVLFAHKDKYAFNITDGKYIAPCIDGYPILLMVDLELADKGPFEFRVLGGIVGKDESGSATASNMAP